MIENGVLPALCKLLNHEKRAIRKECCWALSNISAGNGDQIERVLSIPQLPELLVQVLKNDSWEVKKEAAWAVTNCFSGGRLGIYIYIYYKNR